jgi:hypothetical protein
MINPPSLNNCNPRRLKTGENGGEKREAKIRRKQRLILEEWKNQPEYNKSNSP